LEAVTDYLAQFLLSPQSGLQKGDRAMLVFFPGLDFSITLLACFKAEIIAVPVFPPDPRKLKKDLHHFVSIQSSSGAKVALTNAQFNFVKKVADIKNVFTSVKWPDLQWVQVDDHLKKGKVIPLPSTMNRPSPPPEVIAFLQYTSGSTSEPKGVMISHKNLAHNLKLIMKELNANQSTVNVAWLPQYHDMGLIGSYLGIIFAGGVGFFLSPISFLKDPLVWIKALSTYKGTHTQVCLLAFWNFSIYSEPVF
jgi:acyl-CoA synthetase (AMP-forming)/AMP-acid ligase II